MATTTKHRNWALDCLRLLAVLLVFGRHLMGEVTGPGALFWDTLRRGGWVGVDVFFVLSGYLVGGLLFQEQQAHGSLDWKRFLIRRGLKIYPAFYLWLGVVLAFPLARGELLGAKDVLGEVFFLQNYVGMLRFHTWSLAVEEHFYLLLIVVLTWLSQRNGAAERPFAAVPRLVLSTALLCLGLRLLANQGGGYHLGQFKWTHLRLDSLAFGVLLAYWRVFWPEALSGWVRPCRRWLVLGGLLCLAPVFVLPMETSWWIRTFGFTLNYLGAGALLLASVDFGETRLPSRPSAGAAWLGGASYSIYLWHMDVISQFHTRLHLAWGWSVWATAGASLVASLLVGVAFGRLVEWPVLWWRDRAFPSRTAKERAMAARPS